MVPRPTGSGRDPDGRRAGEQPWNARAYARAYRYALGERVGHLTAVQHATIVARAEDDTESVYLAARFAGCTETEALAAARWDRH